MVKIEEITKDSVLNGIASSQSVKIVSVDHVGDDAVSVVYKDSAGKLGERMLFRSDEPAVCEDSAGFLRETGP